MHYLYIWKRKNSKMKYVLIHLLHLHLSSITASILYNLREKFTLTSWLMTHKHFLARLKGRRNYFSKVTLSSSTWHRFFFFLFFFLPLTLILNFITQPRMKQLMIKSLLLLYFTCFLGFNNFSLSLSLSFFSFDLSSLETFNLQFYH